MKMRPVKQAFVWLLCAVLLLLGARSAVLAQRDESFGMNAFVHGNLFADYPGAASQQKGLGVKWSRVSLHWYWIQPDSALPDKTPDFSISDPVVDSLANQGIDIVGILYEPPQWASSCPTDSGFIHCPPASLNDFETYVRATVAHYKDRISVWQIWYEENNLPNWKTGPDAGLYKDLLERAYQAIKGPTGEDPTATVVLGGLAGVDLNFLKQVHDAGGWSFFDVVAVHPIQRDQPPEFFGRTDDLLRLRALVATYGSKPIWYTEMGWPTQPASGGVSQATQADYLVRDHALAVARGAEGYFWMEFRDRGTNPAIPDQFFGLRVNDTTPKLAYTTYGVLASELGSGAFTRARDSSPGTVVSSFETAETWTSGGWLANPTGFARSTAQAHSGAFSGQWTYSFPAGTVGAALSYIARDSNPLPGTPTKWAIWVKPDDGDHRLAIEFKDAGGEIFRLRMGNTIGTEWMRMQANVSDAVSISAGGDGTVHYPIRFHQVVLENYQTPDFPFYGKLAGTIYVDDIFAGTTSASVHDYQFADGSGGSVDVIWTTGAAGESVPFPETPVTTVDVSGASTIVNDGGAGDADGSVNGKVSIAVTGSPLFVRWTGIGSSAYVLDGLGTAYPAGNAPALVPAPPYFGFDIARDIEFGSTGYYVLDGFGGAHPVGGAPSLIPPPPYFGFDIGRDMELADGGLYVLDGYGGVHSVGSAPALGSPPPPYFGFDIARDMELAGGGVYVLDGYGGVHAVGGAPALGPPPPPYFGFDIARDMEVASTGVYVLDGYGGAHAVGGAPALSQPPPYFGFDIARDLELASTGLYVLDGFGGIHAVGGAPAIVPAPPYLGYDIARDLELR